ncbi:MAG: DUF1735 and LamG domain-containing protein [Rikenellaceae bacterium]|nr:DUF1735 and LamG domain-containing protein [Rikenellaceae bacterium]
MKKLILIITALGAHLLFSGCNEALDYHDVLYITGTEDNAKTNVYIDGPATFSISVTSSKKMEQDVTVYLEIDASILPQFSEEMGDTYEMIPAGSYVLEQNYVTIEAGQNVSLPGKLEILSMDDFVEGVNYCIPVKITGNSLGMDVLASSQYQYFLIQQIITTRGTDMNNSWWIAMPDSEGDPELALSACTMEIRFYANGWRTSGHYISSLIGTEENFLLRIGDEGIKEWDWLQLAGRDNSVSIAEALSLQRWYHVAVVDNGVEMTIYLNGEDKVTVESSSLPAIDLGFYYNCPFAIGQSAADVRYFNGWLSEARLWNRALTPTELTNNECFVDVDKAQGLIGYWRLDGTDTDGSGQTIFRNLAQDKYHGYPKSGSDILTASTATPRWTSDFKCPIVD